jgi:hypothetical protein
MAVKMMPGRGDLHFKMGSELRRVLVYLTFTISYFATGMERVRKDAENSELNETGNQSEFFLPSLSTFLI